MKKALNFNKGNQARLKVLTILLVSKNILHPSYSQRDLTGQDVFVKGHIFLIHRMSSYVFWGIYKQHVSSFNYGKIQTTGAVLVAISIPIFTSQLEKSKAAADAANIRAGYAEVSSQIILNDTATNKTYYLCADGSVSETNSN